MTEMRKYFKKHSKRPKQQSAETVKYVKDTSELMKLAGALGPLGFVREHWIVYDHAGSRYRLDFARCRDKVNIEYDGTSHESRIAQLRDARRDARLLRLGWRVIRVSADAAFSGGYKISVPAMSSRARNLKSIQELLRVSLR